ncbi:MAG: hypothetical protein HY272_07045 [Gammaproteobacteria bacterium]|nr:hypothetical protein [Gammaproteobacteria bacterium]
MAGALPTTSEADFSLNFKPNTTNTTNVGSSGSPNGGYLGTGDNDQGNSCSITGYTDTGCFWFRSAAGTKFGIIEQQPFREEAVSASDGFLYWHVLLGNVNDDWKQDVWIRMGTSQTYMTDPSGTAGNYQWNLAAGTTRISDSGGFTGAYNNQKNAVNGGNYGQVNPADRLETEIYAGTGADALGKYNGRDNTWTGNGTGNPTRVIMRQVDYSPSHGTYQEFLKDQFDRKPLIYQKVVDTAASMTATFQTDMRGLTYTDTRALTIGTTAVTPNYTTPGNGTGNANYTYNAASEFVMKQDFTGSDTYGSHFDASAGRPVVGGALQEQNVTSGRYTFTAGGGWVAYTGGAQQTYYSRYYQGTSPNIPNSSGFTLMPIYQPGTYSYIENNGHMDPTAVVYSNYLDPTQSPCLANPFCP